MAKTPEEIAQEVNTKIDGFKEQIENAATKAELEEATNGMLEFLNKNKDLDTAKLTAQLDEALEKIAVLEEKSEVSNKQKNGIYVDFVKSNIEKNDNIESDRNYAASLTIKAPALMTTANVTPNVAGGFSPLFGNYIDAEIGHTPKADPFILPLVSVTNQPGTESIWYVDRVNEEGDAEFIGEGALKPLADAEWKTTKRPIKEVAVRWKFTKRLMNHAPSVVNDFREHANELVENKMDDGIVSGDDTGNNLGGIQTLGAAFIVPTALANYYVAANIYDAIMAVATRVRLNNFKGQLTCVLNTVWMAKMKGIKDSQERYIIPPFVAPDGTQVGETRIVFTNRVGDDTIMLGDLKKFKVVLAEDVEYDEGYENDDFSKNLVSRKLEAFLGTYIKDSDAGSIVVDDISTVLTAIATV